MIDIRSSFRSTRFGLRLAPAVAAAAALALLVPSFAGAATQTDNSVADFAAGTPGATTYVSDTAGGEVILDPTEGQEFAGTFAETGWLGCLWPAGPFPTCAPGGATVSDGSLHVNGGFAGTVADFAPGRSVEFVATFGAAAFQHVGFTVDWNNDANWAMFSTNTSTTQLQARTNVAGTMTNTNVGAPNEFIGSSHRYRIEWTAAGVNFFIDGTLVHTAAAAASPTVDLRPAASDFDAAAPEVAVDWLHMSPYTTPGTFDSRVFDAGQGSDWGALNWIATEPTDTTVALSVRTGNTPTPDVTWSAFAPVANGADIAASSRYLQYRAQLTTATPDQDETPALNQVSIDYEPTPPAPLPPAPLAAPDSSFAVGKLTGKKLALNVNATGVASVDDAGSQASAASAVAAAKNLLKPSSASGGPGKIVVTLKLTKKAKRKLREKGKIKINAQITFTPTGGTANSQTAKLKIKQKK